MCVYPVFYKKKAAPELYYKSKHFMDMKFLCAYQEKDIIKELSPYFRRRH